VPSTMANKTLAVIFVVMALLSNSPSADEKHISVYSPVAVYTVPIVDRAGREYVGLLELLEPLGRVTSETLGPRWGLHYNAVAAEFVAGRTRARIRGHDFDLSAPFLIENSRGLIPVTSLSDVLPRFVGSAVDFHEGPRRLFVGGVGTQVSFHLDASDPPRLALNFSAPVNPTLSAEPGKLRMIFKRDPILSPGSQSISFDSKVITQASYFEGNGDAEIDIAAVEPLMASFSNNRRTITVVPFQPQARPGDATSAPKEENPSSPGAATSTPPALPHRLVAIVDAAHGGEERGAALTETLAEKNVTLGFARLLRHELELRNFAVVLLRDSDANLTLDQRASSANAARAGIYISLHAVSQGAGAGVYTALLPVEGPSNGIFHPWNAAQAPALPTSRIVSAAIVGEMQKREIPVRASSVSLRPLNNVFMPAIAVELAPGSGGIEDLTSANYQQRAASAIADAIASVRDRLGVEQ
jgi:N-acetylmuramoyl-L-alanine amidase